MKVTVWIYRAECAYHMSQSIQEVTRSVMVKALTQANQLPVDLEDLLASLQHLSDTELWLTARLQMLTQQSTQLERLNRKRQHERLTIAEEQTATVLCLLCRRSKHKPSSFSAGFLTVHVLCWVIAVYAPQSALDRLPGKPIHPALAALYPLCSDRC